MNFEDSTIARHYIKFRPKNIHKSPSFNKLNKLLDNKINFDKILMTLVQFDITTDIYFYFKQKDIEEYARELLPISENKKTMYTQDINYNNITNKYTNNMCKLYPTKDIFYKLGKNNKSY